MKSLIREYLLRNLPLGEEEMPYRTTLEEGSRELDTTWAVIGRREPFELQVWQIPAHGGLLLGVQKFVCSGVATWARLSVLGRLQSCTGILGDREWRWGMAVHGVAVWVLILHTSGQGI